MKSISDELGRAIRPLENKLKLIWFGQFPALGIYVFIASRNVQAAGGEAAASSRLLPIFGMQAVIVLVMSFIFRWFTLSPRAIVNVLTDELPGWVKMMSRPKAGYPAGKPNSEDLQKLNGEELLLYEYSTSLFGNILVQWGLLNTCALFGMILPSHAYQPLAAVVAASMSAGCLLLQFPNIGSRFVAGLELADFEFAGSRRHGRPAPGNGNV